jgi:hypothetical protein
MYSCAVTGTPARSPGLALAVFAFFLTMVGTTLPTPPYPLFERRYSFGPLL